MATRTRQKSASWSPPCARAKTYLSHLRTKSFSTIRSFSIRSISARVGLPLIPFIRPSPSIEGERRVRVTGRLGEELLMENSRSAMLYQPSLGLGIILSFVLLD